MGLPMRQQSKTPDSSSLGQHRGTQVGWTVRKGNVGQSRKSENSKRSQAGLPGDMAESSVVPPQQGLEPKVGVVLGVRACRLGERKTRGHMPQSQAVDWRPGEQAGTRHTKGALDIRRKSSSWVGEEGRRREGVYPALSTRGGGKKKPGRSLHESSKPGR